jgi:hypothetical protein
MLIASANVNDFIRQLIVNETAMNRLHGVSHWTQANDRDLDTKRWTHSRFPTKKNQNRDAAEKKSKKRRTFSAESRGYFFL